MCISQPNKQSQRLFLLVSSAEREIFKEMSIEELSNCETLEDQFKALYIQLPNQLRPLMLEMISEKNEEHSEFYLSLEHSNRIKYLGLST